MNENLRQILKQELENWITFKAYLEQINKDYQAYFKARTALNDSIYNYFSLIDTSNPAVIKLSYIGITQLDEKIKQKVISKYKELFGENAELNVIDKSLEML